MFELLQPWQSELGKSDSVGTILMDLSKAYDCIPQKLSIAKLEAYGVSKEPFCLIESYLEN